MMAKADLSLADTRPDSMSRPTVCCCGSIEGAAYYAWHHNRNSRDDTPILIEFHAAIDRVTVDGKDFLYTAFQFGDPAKARYVIERLFGQKALTYAEAAWASEDQQRRVALCDLCTMDPEVIIAHYGNRVLIGGRHNATFHNAFMVALPVQSESIVRGWSPTNRPNDQTPLVTLSNVW